MLIFKIKRIEICKLSRERERESNAASLDGGKWHSKPLKIIDAINGIHARKYLLPAIQREFVWKPEQIETLFDSLMNDYPINSFLFWKVNKATAKEYQWYEFLQKYHEKDNKHNPEANISGQDDITVVIDGQQRLTSLYIALRGSYTTKKRYSHTEYYTRYLYLDLKDLVNFNDDDEQMLKSPFHFKQAYEAKDESRYFRVPKILDFQNSSEIDDYLQRGYFYDEYDSAERNVIKQNLYKLYEVIREKELIGYYEVESQDINKIVEIFTIYNSGGTKLDLFNIFFSYLISQWSSDLRKDLDNFLDELERYGKTFNRRFFATALLALSDIENMSFKVENLNKNNVEKIQKQYENIKKYIRLSIKLIKSFGFEAVHYTSANIFIPIAYYLQKIGADNNFIDASKYANDRENIRQWYIRSTLKQVFGGADIGFLKKLIRIIKDQASIDWHDIIFPIEYIMDSFRGKKETLIFSDDNIRELMSYRYGDKYTFFVLSLLYPTLDYKNKFHIDHICSKSEINAFCNFFNGAILEYSGGRYNPNSNFERLKYRCDSLSNLQLLEGIINQEKSNKGFYAWLKDKYPDQSQRRDYCKKHYIPNIDDFADTFGMHYMEFWDERYDLIRDKLKEILQKQ